jgi:hypothetical protein
MASSERFEQLYRANAAKVYGWALRYSDQFAVEIASRVVVRLREQTRLDADEDADFDGGEDLQYWLKDETATQARDVPLATAPTATAQTQAEPTTQQDLARRVLAALTVTQRIAVCMTALDERSAKGLGEVLGVPTRDARALVQDAWASIEAMTWRGAPVTREDFVAGLQALDESFPKELPPEIDATLRKALVEKWGGWPVVAVVALYPVGLLLWMIFRR